MYPQSDLCRQSVCMCPNKWISKIRTRPASSRTDFARRLLLGHANWRGVQFTPSSLCTTVSIAPITSPSIQVHSFLEGLFFVPVEHGIEWWPFTLHWEQIRSYPYYLVHVVVDNLRASGRQWWSRVEYTCTFAMVQLHNKLEFHRTRTLCALSTVSTDCTCSNILGLHCMQLQ